MQDDVQDKLVVNYIDFKRAAKMLALCALVSDALQVPPPAPA